MIDNFKNLTVQGGFFDTETSINLFDAKNDRISIIYGRNGSGKSSISKAFREFKENNQQEITGKKYNTEEINLDNKNLTTYNKIELKDFNGNIINTSDIKSEECIYVFDDTYITENIRFAKEGLKSIVMFGKQIKVDDKLVSIQKKIDLDSNELDSKNAAFKKYEEKNNLDNPDKYLKTINDTLKGKNGWAFRDSQIKGYSKKSPVNFNLICSLGKMIVKESKIEIENNLKETQEKYNKVNNSNTKIEKTIDQIKILHDDSYINKLLAVKISKPKVTPREKEILATIQGNHPERVTELEDVCLDNNSSICPFCYQPISEEYKKILLNDINKILNKEVDNHKKELNNIDLQELYLQLDDYNVVNQELVKEIYESCRKYNEIIDRYKKAIKVKITKIYSPLIISSYGLKEHLAIINEKIKELNQNTYDYNVNIDKKDSIKNSLLELNKKLAHFEIDNDFQHYLKKSEAKLEETDNIKSLKVEIKNLQTIEQNLKSEKSNINLAVSKINNALKYIFFKKDRMSVKIDNGLYYIKTYGRYVDIKDISVGERNVLALCYFFCQIFDQCDEGNEYTKKMLLIIDDPISSFDFENKIGIQSYLRYQIKKILEGNTSNKIIIQSHEISTVFDLEKAIYEIKNDFKKRFGKSYGYKTFELKNKKLDKLKLCDFDEYSRLFKDIYGFASQTTGYEKNDLIIGNEMRRLLEAYSSFQYKIGFEYLSTEKNILDKLGNKIYETYFENLMYRLVLHGGSHMKENIKTLSKEYFFNYMSIDEKIRTAKDILVFLFLLDKEHVLNHLVDPKNNSAQKEKKIIENNINEWKSIIG